MTQGRSSRSRSSKGVADVYVRNSTVFQIGNWRAEYQLEHLPQIAEQQGYVPIVWEEQGKSGESLTKRVKMREILLRIKAGTSVAIVCASLDRLSRDLRMIDGSTIWETCREAGAVIITPDKIWRPGEDADDDSAFFQFWGASRENRQRAKNMYEGMVTRAVREPFYRGHVPVGYMREWEPRSDSRGVQKMRSKWVIDPEMVKVIRYIFERYPKQSTNSLVRELNERAEEWWYKAQAPDGTMRRRPWQVPEITRLVQRSVYCGVKTWGSNVQSRRTKSIFTRLHGQKPISHDVPELAIVSQEEWLACQAPKPGSPARARAGLDITPSSAGARRILGALLYCPDCGGRMVASEAVIRSSARSYKIPSYACGTYRMLGGGKCTAHSVYERRLLADLRPIVIDALQQLYDGRLDGALESKSAKRIPSLVEARRAKIISAKNQLYDDYYLEKRISREEFETQTQRWDDELARLDEEAVIVEAPYANLVQLSQFIKAHRSVIEDANGEYATRNFLPIEPSGSPVDKNEKSVRMNDEQREEWFTATHLLFERLDFFYKNNGPRVQATVKLEPGHCTYNTEVALLLNAPPKGKVGGAVAAHPYYNTHHGEWSNRVQLSPIWHTLLAA